MDSAENLWHGLQSVNDWVRFADAKAGAVLASDGVLIAVVAQSSTDETAALRVLPTLALAVASGLLALWALIPRLGMVRPSSPFYFNHVATECSNAKAYREWVLPVVRDPAALAATLSDQIWAMSTVAKRKYKWVRVATWLLGGASCCIVVAGLVEHLG
jgi:hypothetical protein